MVKIHYKCQLWDIQASQHKPIKVVASFYFLINKTSNNKNTEIIFFLIQMFLKVFPKFKSLCVTQSWVVEGNSTDPPVADCLYASYCATLIWYHKMICPPKLSYLYLLNYSRACCSYVFSIFCRHLTHILAKAYKTIVLKKKVLNSQELIINTLTLLICKQLKNQKYRGTDTSFTECCLQNLSDKN